MSSYIVNKFHQGREWATPKLKETAFLDRGVLTPEEFVDAGDELVYKCPTWSWECGDPRKKKNYLPDDKQFLVTRKVPCPTRVASLENSVSLTGEDTASVEEECGGDDWLMSHIITAEQQQNRLDEDLEREFDILDIDGKVLESKTPQEVEQNKINLTGKNEEIDNSNDEIREDEYTDMEDFEDNLDESILSPTTYTTPDEDNDNIIKVRTYDLSITYDKYYQTPRLWMMGYTTADSSQPLTGEQMMEDVMTDYANRTVTIDPHPHVTGPHASIHPCQHGAVMKTIVRNLYKKAPHRDNEDQTDVDSSSSKAPSVDMYLFIFLKFVSSIIPTINYDFTIEVTASTKK